MSFILVSIFAEPYAFSFSQSIFEETFVVRSICPVVLSSAVRFAILVISSVVISIGKHLNSIALLDELTEAT